MKRFVWVVYVMLCTHLVLAQHVTFTGRLTDEDTGEPLIGATLQLQRGLSTVTDFEGKFTFHGLKPKTYQLSIRHIGYEELVVSVTPEVNKEWQFNLKAEPYLADEVLIVSTRADDKTPTTKTTITKEQITKQNLGQDLPFLLNWTPSLVTTSDAGAGIGYTGLRIRGSDASRINVTINGVPLNDSESQGVFWVDIPDIASSTENIQIQRGVGTSTNGAGAFGGTISLQTNTRKNKAYAEIMNSVGSYDTWRHTLGFGTGLLDNRWSVDGRVSKITSDGYIDRASSDLESYYFSGGYYGDKTLIKAILFGGKERTYQSWYGTPEAVLNQDQEGIEAVIANNGLDAMQAANIRGAGRTFNWYLYEDQVDDYAQDHYQLHISQRLLPELTGNLSLHYTYGRGFYEQYQRNDNFSDYGLPDVTIGDSTITSTDLVRRRWLDNDFYGFAYSFNYDRSHWSLNWGGAYNQYRGGHFGEIIWAQFSSTAFNGHRYYDNDGDKDDFNTYLKLQYTFDAKIDAFIDLQYRSITYEIKGIDSDLRALDQSVNYDFFNPKVGFNYALNGNNAVYASFALAHREPIRSDFIDSPDQPEHELLRNLELGYRLTRPSLKLNANFYYMDYKDQLVLTGALNSVGTPLRENVSDSYRAGVELQAGWRLNDRFTWNGNITLSQNKIDRFDEVIYDYGVAFDEFNEQVNTYKDTDIAYSPDIIAGSQFFYTPFTGFEIGLLTKYVGKQYLDNTTNENRKISDYFVNDIRASYQIKTSLVPEVGITLLVNNVFNELYASNGYTFGYQGGPDYVVRENYFYPQAETNFLLSLSLKF